MSIENTYDNDPSSILSSFFLGVRDRSNSRQTQINFRNFTSSSISASSLQPFRCRLGSLVDLNVYDSQFFNITSEAGMLLSEDANSTYLENVSFVD